MVSKKMTDDELRAIVGGYLNDAVGYSDSQISKDRQKALDYYMGRPFGNEVEGRSQVISTDVADTIEGVLPSIIKVFTAGDEVVEFEPVGPEDEEEAKQKTDMANYVFYKENEGFLLLYTWFKDALLQKNGFVKCWWEETKTNKEDTYQGLDDEQYQMLASDKSFKVIEHTERTIPIPVIDPNTGMQTGEQPVTVHDVKIRQEVTDKKVALCNIPPEEVIMTRNAKSVDDCALIGHRTRKTRSELIQMGIKESDLEDQAGEETTLTAEEQARYQDEGGFFGTRSNSDDKSMDEIWYTESYVKVDWDGDGIAELRQVCTVGREGYKIVKNEPFEGMIPISSLTPIILPHKLIGRALAELEMDVQLIKSTVQRQWLDNMYLTNNARMGAVNNEVNLDDLLASRPGGVVRMAKPTSLVPLVTPQLGNQALQALEYMDTVKENRTGLTKYNQGTDANSLNKTASGINAIMGAAQQRIELITRIFAETGVKRVFKNIVELLSKHQDIEKTIRVRNEFVSIDPRSWKSQNNVTINVGLGTGNKDQQLVHLSQILGVQKEIIMSPFASLVTAENVYNSSAELTKNSGFKNPEKFFTKPPTQEELAQQPQQQPAPPPPDPNMIKVQQDGQMQQQKMQADTQQAQTKMQSDAAIQQQQIGLKHQEVLAQIEFDRYKFDQELALKEKLGVIDAMIKAKGQQQQHDASISSDDSKASEPDNAGMDSLIETINNAAQLFLAPKQMSVVRDANGNMIGGTSAPMVG